MLILGLGDLLTAWVFLSEQRNDSLVNDNLMNNNSVNILITGSNNYQQSSSENKGPLNGHRVNHY